MTHLLAFDPNFLEHQSSGLSPFRRKLKSLPLKKLWLEDDPLLLGFGNLSGAFAVKLQEGNRSLNESINCYKSIKNSNLPCPTKFFDFKFSKYAILETSKN